MGTGEMEVTVVDLDLDLGYRALSFLGVVLRIGTESGVFIVHPTDRKRYWLGWTRFGLDGVTVTVL